MSTFDLETLSQQISAFATEVPKILRQSNLTQDLADEIQRCLDVSNESRFTLAIVGQMKAGKSTLINALVGGEKDLAITGVTETTATINRLLHGTEEQAKTFQVFWKDVLRGSEIKDLDERDKWIGDSSLAQETRYLEFYSTAEFLKRVQIIDTPGTGSTLQAHGETLRGFLLDKAEHDTRYYGGLADCVIYVIPPVVRQSDSDLLNEFKSHTRLPNTSPYNSIALLHKWEALIDHPQPWIEAQNKATTAFSQLQEGVSAVLPISGPLSLAVQRCGSRFWSDVVKLVAGTPSEVLQKLLMSESRFTSRENENCSLDASGRRGLYEASGIVWPSFVTIFKIALHGQISDGQKLKTAVAEASGMATLHKLLEERFFSRARLIQSSNLLRKALEPAEKARIRLRQRRADLNEKASLANRALAELEHTGDRFQNTRTFVADARSAAEKETETLTGQIRRLEAETRNVRESFESFTGDLKAIAILHDHPEAFSDVDTVQLLTILGAYGGSLDERLSRLGNGGDRLKEVKSLHSQFLERFHRATEPNQRIVFGRIVARLEEATLLAADA